MTRFLIRRALGDISEDQLDAAADESTRVRVEQFPDIEWEYTNVVRGPDGLTAYCVYAADSEERLRDHARAAGLPLDDLAPIEHVLRP